MTLRFLVSNARVLLFVISLLICFLSSWSAGKNTAEIMTLTGFCTLLAFISVQDHTNHKIPNKLTLFPIPIVFFFSFLMPNIYEFSPIEIWWVAPLFGSLIGGIIFSICYFLPKATLGGGDVKLAILIGSITGFPLCLASLLIGLLIFVVKQGLHGNKESSPLALYLYCGTLISIIVAQQL